jgi:UDP-N-acetylmuramoyl-tripeptide--D-alanyl-D-alanine ligase
MKFIIKKIIVFILILESKLIIKKYKPFIVAVTGSVGKTSTKDAIYTVLANNSYVRKSEKSFNSDIGIPLTILGCQNGWSDLTIWLKNILHGLELILFKSKYPECLVLEVGADHPNDIKKVSKWLKTDIAVITKVSEIPVHVEFFPTPEDVLKEKLYLAESLKNNGILIVSADDKRLVEASKNYKQKVMTFGIDNLATVSASDISMNIKYGVSFKLNYEGNSIPVNIKGAIGNQFIYPILAASVVGIARNISISKIIESIPNHTPSKGRMNILSGINGGTLIDDTYNSSPDAVSEALNALSKIDTTGKKIAVLGDMMELGKYSADEHRKIGEKAMKVCNILVTVGPRAKLMSKDSVHFDSSINAGEYVKGIIGEGDIVLLKGSQSIRLERAAKILLVDPDKASDLLVRQEAEWLAKK